MSLKKIIFIAVAIIVLLATIVGIMSLGNKKPTTTEIPKVLTLWITQGSSEEYKGIIEGFKEYAPEYKDTEIIVEKKTSDPIRYRTLLLNTFTDRTGPDIFMLSSGEDRILEGKREPIPEKLFTHISFENEYEDIFLGLLSGSTSTDSDKEESGRFVLGVPLGFETLGIFYNKALLREIPKTWDEIERLYSINLGENKYPTNLGLGPRFTPNASDIISIFAKENTYSSIGKNNDSLKSYLNFRNLEIAQDVSDDDIYAPRRTVLSSIDPLEKDKKTTYDLFMQGDIAMILGFPSIVNELEKSTKRSGSDSIENLVLTAPVAQDSLGGDKKNVAHYPYLSISTFTKSPQGSLKFLEYLTTDDGIRKIQEVYPYLIPPKPSLYESWKGRSLSKVLSRTRLDSFIPDLDVKLRVFDYGLRAEFDIFLTDSIDRNENIDINNTATSLVSTIDCSIGLYFGNELSSDCEKKE